VEVSALVFIFPFDILSSLGEVLFSDMCFSLDATGRWISIVGERGDVRRGEEDACRGEEDAWRGEEGLVRDRGDEDVCRERDRRGLFL